MRPEAPRSRALGPGSQARLGTSAGRMLKRHPSGGERGDSGAGPVDVLRTSHALLLTLISFAFIFNNLQLTLCIDMNGQRVRHF